MSDGGKGDTRRATVVPREIFAARWLRAFGVTFPCATCEGRGTIAMRAPECPHHHGACPCGSIEVECAECIEGAVVCGMCGARAAVQEARGGGVICYTCATEEDDA